MNKKSKTNKRFSEKKTLAVSLIIIGVITIAAVILIYDWKRKADSDPNNPNATTDTNQTGDNQNDELENANFPVKLPGSATYSINEFSGGFSLLTEAYVYTYNADGSPNYDCQHGYAAPRASVNSNSNNGGFLLYDENGRKFSFFGNSGGFGKIYEKETEEQILYGAIGKEGKKIAVVIKDATYANAIEIYDSTGDWKFRTKLNENVMQIAFAGGDNDIIVTAISADSGDIVAYARKYDTTSDGDYIFSAELPKSSIPYAVYVSGNRFFVLCDNSLSAFDLKNGNKIGEYEFRGTLKAFDFSDSQCVLLIDDSTAGKTNLISLDSSAKPSGFREIADGASSVRIINEKGEIAVLVQNKILTFGESLSSLGEIELSEEFSQFISVKGGIFLLGYNTVDFIGA